MAETQETIVDIIAEKRRLAEQIRNNLSTVPVRQWDQQAEIKFLEDDADRLEAALKHELSKNASKNGAVFGQLGDMAKLREAVKAVVDVGYPHNFQREAPHIRGYCYDITRAIEKCFAALAAPPRNCDAHTADELKVKFNSELVLELPIANEHEKNLVTITAMGVIDTLFATTQEGGAK